ncbi:MAG: AmmeMemoRadiSam system protein B [Candidatus Aenigmatarchaeota archaeon]
MIIRNPIAVGQFYPRNSGDIESMLDKFLRRAKIDKKGIIGGVVPHAGYMYCGETQAHVYKSLLGETKTFVILGPNHSNTGANEAIMTSGMWKTPLGSCQIDSDLANTILENSDHLKSDYNAHNQEHSIEVQLPWLQHKLGSVNIVPIAMRGKSQKKAQDIGEAIEAATQETAKKFIVLASSDFTHFGRSYGYTPVSGGPSAILDYVEKVDREAGEAIENLSPESFLDTVEKYNATICGTGPIAAMLYALKDKAKGGRILHHSTSYDVSKDKNSIVGYSGITIE